MKGLFLLGRRLYASLLASMITLIYSLTTFNVGVKYVLSVAQLGCFVVFRFILCAMFVYFDGLRVHTIWANIVIFTFFSISTIHIKGTACIAFITA